MPENEDTIISYGQTKTKSTLCPVVASACQVTLTWLTWGRTTLHTAWSHSSQNSPDSQESGRKLQGFHYWYSVHYWAAYPISDQILETRILFPWSASYGKRKETIKYRGARSDRIRAISDDHQGEEIDRDQSRPWSNSSSPRKFLRRCPRSINFKLKFTWRARLHLRLGFRQSPRVPHFPHYSETSLLPHCPAPIPSPLAVVAACIHFKILIDRVIDRFWRLSDRIGSDRIDNFSSRSDRIGSKKNGLWSDRDRPIRKNADRTPLKIATSPLCIAVFFSVSQNAFIRGVIWHIVKVCIWSEIGSRVPISDQQKLYSLHTWLWPSSHRSDGLIGCLGPLGNDIKLYGHHQKFLWVMETLSLIPILKQNSAIRRAWFLEL